MRRYKPRTDEQKRRHRECEAARRAANPEAHRLAVKRFAERHPDRVQAIWRNQRVRAKALYPERKALRDREYQSRPYVLEKKRIATRKHYAEHGEKTLAIRNERLDEVSGLLQRRLESLKKYNNSDARRTYMREWVQKNKDKHNEYGRRAYHERDKFSPYATAARLFSGVRNRAKSRNLSLSVTVAWIERKLENGVCEVSGLPFVLGKGWNAYSPSIDRIDNALGYTTENCQMVLWAVNRFKAQDHLDDMLKIACAIADQCRK
jgi:hypothetical protein